MDLLLERDNNKENFGDMIFVNGACPTTTEFIDAVAQKVFILLRTFQAEWYLNTTTGIPYLQDILGKKIKKSTIDRIIQEKILQVEGVASIEAYTSTMGGDRVYSATLNIKTTQGTTFSDVVNIL